MGKPEPDAVPHGDEKCADRDAARRGGNGLAAPLLHEGRSEPIQRFARTASTCAPLDQPRAASSCRPPADMAARPLQCCSVVWERRFSSCNRSSYLLAANCIHCLTGLHELGLGSDCLTLRSPMRAAALALYSSFMATQRMSRAIWQHPSCCAAARTGSIPAEWSALPLTFLDLSNNSLTGLRPRIALLVLCRMLQTSGSL